MPEGILLQRLWRHDVARDNVAADKSEGEMELAEVDEEMVLEL